MSDRLLNPDQLSEKLNVPKSWIYNKTREIGPNAIPRVRVGKYIRFVEADVMNWLRRRHEENTQY